MFSLFFNLSQFKHRGNVINNNMNALLFIILNFLSLECNKHLVFYTMMHFPQLNYIDSFVILTLVISSKYITNRTPFFFFIVLKFKNFLLENIVFFFICIKKFVDFGVLKNKFVQLLTRSGNIC